jgi:hypothetical protein
MPSLLTAGAEEEHNRCWVQAEIDNWELTNIEDKEEEEEGK